MKFSWQWPRSFHYFVVAVILTVTVVFSTIFSGCGGAYYGMGYGGYYGPRYDRPLPGVVHTGNSTRMRHNIFYGPRPYVVVIANGSGKDMKLELFQLRQDGEFYPIDVSRAKGAQNILEIPALQKRQYWLFPGLYYYRKYLYDGTGYALVPCYLGKLGQHFIDKDSFYGPQDFQDHQWNVPEYCE